MQPINLVSKGMSSTQLQLPNGASPEVRLWRPLHAELAVGLPSGQWVRREILDFGRESSQWILRPDGSGAEASVRFDGRGLLATLRGPERADLDIDFMVLPDCPAIPLWAIASGSQVEVSIWDHFGRLAVPDVLARTCDAEDLRLEPGRYLLQGSVQRLSSVLLGIGLDATPVRLAHGQRAAG